MTDALDWGIDWQDIEEDEQALVRGSLAVYAVPVVLLLLGGLVGELGARQFLWQSAELASTVLGLAGLLAGLWWLRGFTRRIRDDRQYQPAVLRRAGNGMPLAMEESKQEYL